LSSPRDLGRLSGIDSCLWGNPQWQIEAFRKFQIPEIKAKVFGLNAARIWNLKTA
jgi:hypothetical protein